MDECAFDLYAGLFFVQRKDISGLCSVCRGREAGRVSGNHVSHD